MDLNGNLVHIGIIDYLQEWNTNKKAENCFKTACRSNKNRDISAVNPQKYQHRFVKYANNLIFKKMKTKTKSKSDVEFEEVEDKD